MRSNLRRHSARIGARAASQRGDRLILLGLFINSLLGFAFALCARDRVRADGPFAAPAFWIVLTFAGLIAAPATLYLYIAHPAWSWLYALDPDTVPAALGLPVFIIVVGSLVGSWLGGSQLLRVGRERALWIGLAVTAAAGLISVAMTAERLVVYGSYPVFAAGEARGLLEVKLGYVLIAFSLGLLTAASFVAVELVRDSRQARIRREPRMSAAEPKPAEIQQPSPL